MFRVRLHPFKSLRWWWLHRSQIDLAPPYQRKGGVWKTSDRQLLIDSILNEYDIPKFYLADFTAWDTKLNKDAKPYAVVDGRQRFEAIFQFFDNQFSLSKKFRLFSDPKRKAGGMSYDELQKHHPDLALRFEEYNLHIMSIETDEEEKIHDLFRRLNKSYPLSGAELRNALVGDIPETIRLLTEHDFFKSRVRFSTKRGAEYNAAAKLLLLEYSNEPVDLKKRALDAFAELGTISSLSTLSGRVVDVLDNMAKVFQHGDPLLRTEGQLPVYYWLVRDLGAAKKLREFLDEFEAERKLVATIGDEKLDEELAFGESVRSYALYNRATNDKGSIQRRYEILKKCYALYCKS